MTHFFRKLLLVACALLIAGAVTYYPWTYLDELPGSAGYVYFLFSIVWAPLALAVGIALGIAFAWALWPARKKLPRPPDPKPGNEGSFEA